MKTRSWILAILVGGSTLHAQNYLDVLRPFLGVRGITGAESGVVPAGIATGNALAGNPALLSYADKTSIEVDFSHHQIDGVSVFNAEVRDRSSLTAQRFNSLTYIKPVRVYRGAWVWGVNLQQLQSFHGISRFGDMEPDDDFGYAYSQEQSGEMYALNAATSVMVTMNTSIGYGLSLLLGENSYKKFYEETDPDDLYTFERFESALSFNPSYVGFGARIGILSEVSETMNLGFSLELPSRISVSESASRDTLEVFDDGSRYVSDRQVWSGLEYKAWGPWRIGVGLGFVARPLHASMNYRYHSYSTIFLKGDLYDDTTGENVEDIVKEQVNTYIQDVHEFSASLVWSMDPLTLTLAGAVMNDPLNFQLDDVIRVDFGIGYQLSSGLGFSLAMRNEQWQSNLNHTLASGVQRAVDVDNSSLTLQFGIKYNL